ncbi:MAG: phosphoribosylanthranilate isomerase [Desulfobulbaceae bacterium]|nr:phosphoribosylanthranilate isomerase [Desulfobulbaceae bacterium]
MTARTRIKVCGMTDIAEASGLVAAGVDALGFIFVEKSPRNIEPEKAREIIASLPPFVDAVGVFVDQDRDVVDDIVKYCGLTMVQLHGSESPQYCETVNARVVKSFSIRPDVEFSDTNPFYDPYLEVVSGILLDTYHEKLAGGTGKTFDWELIKQCRPAAPLVLAGGLTPENIADAIRQVRPFAVDVNSGVEISPGVKDVGAVERLVETVRVIDQEFHD